MNRLIIIGNGFDLAHRIKTSFEDFIADYLVKAILIYLERKYYSDILLDIRNIERYRDYDFLREVPNTENAFELFNKLILNTNVKVNLKSPILENVYDKISTMNWVDIEYEFFSILVETREKNKGIDIRYQIEEVKKINDQMDYLKNKLIEYLKVQESNFNNSNAKKPIVSCFSEKILRHDIVTTRLEEDIFPEILYFLNFNYTKTFYEYMNDCPVSMNIDFNYIHGNLDGSYGVPIFGFGDEFDKKYLEFEEERNNELFKHIKSFEYSKTQNYHKLIRFIDSEAFQVHIYGHSCGISDRTMLNQIFENANCRSIKVFYHERKDKSNDFIEKTYEIARHFTDKKMFRRKLVPFDRSDPMPQPRF